MKSPRFFRRGLFITAATCAAAVLLWWWLSSPSLPPAQPAPDPRLAYRGPYLNVHPDVKYVGTAACAECHAEIVESYHGHPMGRSLFATSTPFRPAGATGGSEEVRAFPAFSSRFEVAERDGKLYHQQTRQDSTGKPLFTHAMEAQYAIGSGNHGHSFLTVRDGFMYQTPISWFTQGKVWDLSPTFGERWRDGRPITGECLFCHVNRALEQPGYVNRYRAPYLDGHAIGCERCHGPGGLHVRGQQIVDTPAGKIDVTIVNPQRLEHDLRESICQQCHLDGAHRIVRRSRDRYDFRPGMHLKDFMSVLVDARRTTSTKAVNHAQQMYVSRCYQASGGATTSGGAASSPSAGRLGCLSCHDPHRKIAAEQRVTHYRAACLKCHAADDCTLPHEQRHADNKQDSCIACHMPRYAASDVAHTASTDHRIPRKPSTAGDPDEARPSGPMPDDALVSFFVRNGVPAEAEDVRDLAIARVNLAIHKQATADSAIAPLQAAWKRDPGDLEVGDALGTALWLTGRHDEAVPVLRAVLARQPAHETALFTLAYIKTEARDGESIELWRRLTELNPTHPDYRAYAVKALTAQNVWSQAERHCRVWVGLEPWSVSARQQWAHCLQKSGKFPEAAEQERMAVELERR